MAPSSSIMNKGKDAILKFSKDPANMLLWTATLGWVLSAAGQLASILTNKKISKKEKRFLVPQEAADAFINISSFFIITRTIQGASKKLVSKGKVLTPKIKNFCNQYGIRITKDADGNVANISKDLSAEINKYNAVLDVNKENKSVKLNLSEGQIKDIENKVKILSHFKDETYGPFESGIGVIGNILGGIISGNIITPMLRNPMAAYKQKTSIEREQLEKDAKLYNENKVILAQNGLNIDNYKSQTINSRISSGGSMRI